MELSVTKRASRTYRPPLLWIALSCGLLLAFLIDQPVAVAVAPHVNSGFALFLIRVIRPLGMGNVQIPLLLAMMVLGLWRNRRLFQAARCGFLAFALAGVTASIMKVLVHRERPLAVVTETSSWVANVQLGMQNSGLQSFPSGETSCSFTLAVVLGIWYPRYRWLFITAAAIIALARVWVGSHFPSDVIAGVILGTVAGKLAGRWLPDKPQPAETTTLKGRLCSID